MKGEKTLKTINEYIINYKFLGQDYCRSYHKCFSFYEIKDWLERLQNNTLESDANEIDLVLINFLTTPISFCIQLHRKEIKHSCGDCFKEWGEFEVLLIINDSVIGKLNSIKDLCHLLRIKLL